ncbi:hypothetical protein BB561_005769 [Smittium simulii]|uniref:Velvet domain-containing protein n=1 Tax=Smittium simulii TaxID=133385 RepID=A0A2T9Y8D4_9FUNG|nr:hypothetical protein BB561_005769 [Smittium simulii]
MTRIYNDCNYVDIDNLRFFLDFDHYPKIIKTYEAVDSIICSLKLIGPSNSKSISDHFNTSRIVAFISLVSLDCDSDFKDFFISGNNLISGSLVANGESVDDSVTFTFKMLKFNVVGKYKLGISVVDMSRVLESSVNDHSSLILSKIVSGDIEIV